MIALTPFLLRDHGVLTMILAPEPDLAAGNAQFFDPDPACLIQLRPLLAADYGAWGHGRRGNALLYARAGNGVDPDIACYVRVPPHLRKNNRPGVMYAIGRLARFDQASANQLLEIAARTRWPRPETRSWTP